MNSTDLCFLSLARAARLIESRELSPVDLTRAVLNRIDSSAAAIFIEVHHERAIREARLAEAEIGSGDYRGAMHGIPVALKDIFDVKGLKTTAGSRLWDPAPAAEDSEVARRLSAAGAVLVGKTNLHEFAYGGTNINHHFGTPANPWDATRIPGGSSGGSAVALALGMAFFATGSDTGGSIRGPAAYCGVTGLKPTFGRVSRRGVTPVSMTLDHVGPMARSALDCALALSVIAGHDPLDPYSADVPNEDYSAGIDVGVRGLRIAVPTSHFFDGLEPDVESLVRSAVEVLGSLGAELVEMEIPWAGPRDSCITRVELAAVHRQRLEDPEFAAGLRRGTLTRMWDSDPVSANRYALDLHRKMELVRLGEETMQEVDLIAAPSAPRAAPTIAEAETRAFLQGHRYFGGAFNQSGQPSMSVPCGFTEEGLPEGLMLTGGLWKDRLVLRAGHAYQQVTDWHLRRPPGVV